jgi:hypothetical protein
MFTPFELVMKSITQPLLPELEAWRLKSTELSLEVYNPLQSIYFQMGTTAHYYKIFSNIYHLFIQDLTPEMIKDQNSRMVALLNGATFRFAWLLVFYIHRKLLAFDLRCTRSESVE